MASSWSLSCKFFWSCVWADEGPELSPVISFCPSWSGGRVGKCLHKFTPCFWANRGKERAFLYLLFLSCLQLKIVFICRCGIFWGSIFSYPSRKKQFSDALRNSDLDTSSVAVKQALKGTAHFTHICLKIKEFKLLGFVSLFYSISSFCHFIAPHW